MLKGLKKKVPCKHQSKEGWSDYINIRQNRLQNKDYYQGEVGTLHQASIHHVDITILNVYPENNRASNYMKKI